MGMTLKQFARMEFHAALEAYKTALLSGDSAQIVATSLRIHQAKAGVPKSWHPMVNRTFRDTKRMVAQ